MTEHMVAVFASESAAAAAERELEQAGVPRAAIRRYAEGTASAPDASARPDSVETIQRPAGGFWSWLLGLGETTEVVHRTYPDDGGAYDRSLASGHYVLSVAVADDSKIHEAVTILERHEPLDIDEHTEEEDTPEEAGARSSVAVSGTDYSSGATAAPTTGVPPSDATARQPGTTDVNRSAAAREEVIPLAEEQLEAGTRSVDRGTNRVRRYVVEQPVDRDVTLDGERVTVERRRPT
ncbi:MAG: hypothetical protein BGO51_05845 [Rhodospirillales bacterium 69-11]|nr:DUF2382 domain-containing protein [Rhodospirillales bacterium]OJW27243.1 MAG: hypothetical protein BGO51_05845 [Rhodospirillales bacterium 69-11]